MEDIDLLDYDTFQDDDIKCDDSEKKDCDDWMFTVEDIPFNDLFI
jgi:hypothetical protein